MKKISAFFKSLFLKDGFIRVLSVVLAIGIWLYIVNIADPRSTREYSDIPVYFNYVGSTPDTNDLMPILTSTSFNVRVRVSGPRTGFLNFSKDKITARLDMNSVAAEGTYNIPIFVTTQSDDLTCQIVGDSYISIEFKKKSSVTLPLIFEKIGNYVAGYEEVKTLIEPQTVTITGPQEVVSSIATAEARVSVVGIRENFNKMIDISLFDADGNAVDRTYLSFDAEQAYVSVELAYRKDVPIILNTANRYGGNESSYTDIVFSKPTIKLQGPEAVLAAMDGIYLDTIYMDTIRGTSTTFTLPLIYPEGIVSVDGIDQVTATVNIGDAKTKAITFTAADFQRASFSGLDMSKYSSASIDTKSLKVLFRSQPDIINSISAEDFILTVDMTTEYENTGKYLLNISLPDNIPGGFLTQYYVSVSLTPNESPTE